MKLHRHLVLFIALCFIIICGLFAQETIPIAVLDLEAIVLSDTEARILTDRLSAELFKTQQFSIIERDKMNDILQEQGFQNSGCVSTECAVEIGRLIGVKMMVAGSVAKIGKLHSLNLRLIDVESGEVIRVATQDCECTIEEVLTQALPRSAYKLANTEYGESESKIYKSDTPKNIKTVEYKSDLKFASALKHYEYGQFEDCAETLRTIFNETDDQYTKLQTLTAMLELSKNYEEFKEFVPSTRRIKSSEYKFYNNLKEFRTEPYKNLSFELKLKFAEKLIKWNREYYAERSIEDLIFDAISNEDILVRSYYLSVKYELADYDESLSKLKKYFPDHPYTQELMGVNRD